MLWLLIWELVLAQVPWRIKLLTVKYHLLSLAHGLIPGGAEINRNVPASFLKVLEEPPRGMVFLFLAENQGDLLSTIVSRSQVVRIRPILDRDNISRLIAAGYTEEDARYLVEIVEDESELAVFVSHPLDIAAAVEEERLTREKQTRRFPSNAIKAILEFSSMGL